MRGAVVALCCCLAGGCGPCGGAERDDNRLERYVDALIAEPGSLADTAGAALAARGRDAIVILETGLYRAEPDGRVRIVRTLARIGHPDALPILVHLSERDSSPEVREEARLGIERLNSRAARESK